jgi:hypothetical protein
MTTDDLSTLLREHVGLDEPAHVPDLSTTISAGRRRLRGQRLAAGTAAAAVVTVAGIAATTAWPAGSDDGPTTAIDPATSQALADYDAQQMPRLLDEHASAVFSRSVPALPTGEFRAGDGQGNELPPRLYDKASGMSISYGDGTDHQLSVSLDHARSEAEGSARRYCEVGLSDGTYLSCEVSAESDGSVAITKEWALRPMNGPGWMAVSRDEIDRVDPDRLWFQREAKVVHSETFVTYVSETVQAPDRASADAEFQVPVEDLVELGTDPVLVIPEPPTDPSGCGPWTMPDSDVTYSC